jgi:hypothetical protein
MYIPPTLPFNNSAFCPAYTYGFCTTLRTNSVKVVLRLFVILADWWHLKYRSPNTHKSAPHDGF